MAAFKGVDSGRRIVIWESSRRFETVWDATKILHQHYFGLFHAFRDVSCIFETFQDFSKLFETVDARRFETFRDFSTRFDAFRDISRLFDTFRDTFRDFSKLLETFRDFSRFFEIHYNCMSKQFKTPCCVVSKLVATCWACLLRHTYISKTICGCVNGCI